GYSAGGPKTFTYQGSLVPQSAVPSYLKPGPAGFVTLNWPAFAGATNYQAFHNAALNNAANVVTAANTTAGAGHVEEKIKGFYLELTGDTMILDHRLRYTAGARYVRTDQTIGGYVSVPSNSAFNLQPNNTLPNGKSASVESPADGA